MGYEEKLYAIDDLQTKVLERGPIPANLLNKINYKFRLEWNYTSNSMEGNSLTKRETRTVMVDAIDVNHRPIKDVMEIRNHDKVINTIMKIGKAELNISESRIKEIHKGIMYEEDSSKLKLVGQWKDTDNYMYNFEGERYDFVPHSEVSKSMHDLINWLNTEKEKIAYAKGNATHPAIIAFKFHIDYLTIHPFYDGNGRTARILSNLILISYGFPPIYIKETEKEIYYRYLTDIQSNGGSPELFYEFMSDLLFRSMQITLDTLEGKEIEEEDDFIKEIQLLKAKAKSKGTPKSPKVIYDTFKIIENSLWADIMLTLNHFESLFNETRTIRKVNHKEEIHGITNLLDALAPMSLFQKPNEPPKLKIFGHDVYENDLQTISFEHKMFALNGDAHLSDFAVLLQIKLLAYKYHIYIKATGTGNQSLLKSIFTLEKRYLEDFFPEELADINFVLRKYLIDEIKQKIDNSEDDL